MFHGCFDIEITYFGNKSYHCSKSVVMFVYYRQKFAIAEQNK